MRALRSICPKRGGHFGHVASRSDKTRHPATQRDSRAIRTTRLPQGVDLPGQIAGGTDGPAHGDTLEVMSFSTAPIAGGSLIGGYVVARFTKKRPLGGVVLLAGGAAAASQWRKQGTAVTTVLLGTYLGGFGASHPLAKKIGAWPSVFTVSAISAGASYLLSDRRATGATS